MDLCEELKSYIKKIKKSSGARNALLCKLDPDDFFYRTKQAQLQSQMDILDTVQNDLQKIINNHTI